MAVETITFQFATHYLPRVALQLEYLFLPIQQACVETHPIIHHYALKNIIEIIKRIEKPELKSRFLKEFMRIEHLLNKSKKTRSDPLYTNLFIQIQLLTHAVGRFGENIHNDLFLQSIRLAETGYTNDYELYSPQLLLWLEGDSERRQHDLAAWLKQLRALYETSTIYLSLLRNSAEFTQIDMFNGFYQCSLPAKTTCHLILLKMNKNCGVVPKMQLGQHGFSLRLCDANSMHEVRSTDTIVQLAICQL